MDFVLRGLVCSLLGLANVHWDILLDVGIKISGISSFMHCFVQRPMWQWNVLCGIILDITILYNVGCTKHKRFDDVFS